MNTWTLAAGLVAFWLALVALALFGMWRLLRAGRSAEADRKSAEWAEDMERRGQRLHGHAGRPWGHGNEAPDEQATERERADYTRIAAAIRGPTSLAEREVAEIFERKDF